MAAELLFSGYYRGPETFLDTYTFLRCYRGDRWVFADSEESDYDFADRLRALGLAGEWDQAGWLVDGPARVCWGKYRRGTNLPALNWGGQVVGCLADALESVDWFGGQEQKYRFQVEVLGPGQLRPTIHNVVLTFVPDQDAEPGAAADRRGTSAFPGS